MLAQRTKARIAAVPEATTRAPNERIAESLEQLVDLVNVRIASARRDAAREERLRWYQTIMAVAKLNRGIGCADVGLLLEGTVSEAYEILSAS